MKVLSIPPIRQKRLKDGVLSGLHTGAIPYPTLNAKGTFRMGHPRCSSGRPVVVVRSDLLDGVGDVGAVDDVVLVIEVENGEVVRAGRQAVVLVYIGSQIAAQFLAVIPDLYLADGDRFRGVSNNVNGRHIKDFAGCR